MKTQIDRKNYRNSIRDKMKMTSINKQKKGYIKTKLEIKASYTKKIDKHSDL